MKEEKDECRLLMRHFMMTYHSEELDSRLLAINMLLLHQIFEVPTYGDFKIKPFAQVQVFFLKIPKIKIYLAKSTN